MASVVDVHTYDLTRLDIQLLIYVSSSVQSCENGNLKYEKTKILLKDDDHTSNDIFKLKLKLIIMIFIVMKNQM